MGGSVRECKSLNEVDEASKDEMEAIERAYGPGNTISAKAKKRQGGTRFFCRQILSHLQHPPFSNLNLHLLSPVIICILSLMHLKVVQRTRHSTWRVTDRALCSQYTVSFRDGTDGGKSLLPQPHHSLSSRRYTDHLFVELCCRYPRPTSTSS
jgi:hypothetical protein